MGKSMGIILGLLLLCPVTAPPAHSAQFGGIRELSVYPFIQYFTWEEYSGGERLLKESGPQYGAGGVIKLALLEGSAGALTLSDRLEFFGGVVDYDGQYQDGIPLKTDVNYFGVMNQLDCGWAIPLQAVTVEPFAGLGYRWWLRDLQGSGGYTEYWSTLYGVFGMRSQYRLSGDSDFFVSGAAKYHFHNRNNVDFPGTGEVELEPGSDWSVIADAGIRYRQLVTSVYYENFVFPKSPVSKGLFQPRSESEIFGLRIGWAFR